MKAAEAALVVPASMQYVSHFPECRLLCFACQLADSRCQMTPLKTFPLQVLLSLLPMSQELPDSTGSYDDRLLTAKGETCAPSQFLQLFCEQSHW